MRRLKGQPDQLARGGGCDAGDGPGVCPPLAHPGENTIRLETISVQCPRCGRQTPNDIPRYGGAQAYRHARGAKRADCVFVVVPDPEATDHWTELVPTDREMCDFLEGLLNSCPEVRQRHRKLLALGAAYAA